jgi:hypothetical protein
MLKPTSVFLFFVMFITGTMNGQTFSDPPKPKENRADLRQVFSAETGKLKNESASLDAKKLNRAPRQVTRNNWSKTKTTWAVIITVVVVGALYVIVKNTTRCVSRQPSGCSFVDDPDCVCTKYER